MVQRFTLAYVSPILMTAGDGVISQELLKTPPEVHTHLWYTCTMSLNDITVPLDVVSEKGGGLRGGSPWEASPVKVRNL